ncbi:hypothetical protein GJ496_000233 [Pomphorhynchus laevis]|nr:hypothetical protein GJ496_000233 [Pomphorhynchus laevis]
MILINIISEYCNTISEYYSNSAKLALRLLFHTKKTRFFLREAVTSILFGLIFAVDIHNDTSEIYFLNNAPTYNT